jgi:hypothetical protein
MYQSSTRNNFLDILADPTAIALLGSIALHAIIAASLPFFPHPDKEGKKAEPGTVKVVELTPSELQRIPQAPPIPTPQVLPPVTPPINPISKVATPPSTPPISPNSPTIPFSPIRIPLEQVNPKPFAGNKEQKAIPQPQPTAPIFDPKISLKPTPKPSQPSVKKDITLKPIPKPKPKPVNKVLTPPDLSQTVAPDDDGGDSPPTTTPATTPTQPTQSTAVKPAPASGTTKSTPPAQSPNQPSGDTGDNNSSWVYGKYAAAASERIQQYLTAYPDLKLYKPQLLLQSYPVGAPCSKVKQSPFIVLMAAFDKVPENADNNPLGDSTAPSIDKPYVAADRDTPENRKLGELAVNTALYEANKADQNRPAADKGKRVLYQYRVQFDPTTCKK